MCVYFVAYSCLRLHAAVCIWWSTSFQQNQLPNACGVRVLLLEARGFAISSATWMGGSSSATRISFASGSMGTSKEGNDKPKSSKAFWSTRRTSLVYICWWFRHLAHLPGCLFKPFKGSLSRCRMSNSPIVRLSPVSKHYQQHGELIRPYGQGSSLAFRKVTKSRRPVLQTSAKLLCWTILSAMVKLTWISI